MINAIFHGVLLGLVLSIMIGPVFFLLLDTSIKKGFKPAVYLALGVALSDVMFITICFFGNSLMGSLNAHSTQIGWLGGGLLIIFGLVALFKKVALSEEELKLPDDSKTLLIDTGKGFMMNTLNPFVLVFWLGVITAVNAGQFGGKAFTLFFFNAVPEILFIQTNTFCVRSLFNLEAKNDLSKSTLNTVIITAIKKNKVNAFPPN